MDVFPVGIAAGMIREAKHIERDLEQLATSIVFGSFTSDAHVGNPEPFFWFDPVTEASINAVNLRNNGLAAFLETELPLIVERLRGSEARIHVSLAPLKSGDLGAMCALIMQSPYLEDIACIEINAACPNHRGEHGLHPVLAYDPEAVSMLLSEAKVLAGMSRSLKIAPRTRSETLAEIVRLALHFGVDAIVSGNTLFGSAIVDGKQVLSVPQGGHGGLPLLADGVKQVALLRSILAEVDKKHRVAIVACGGIMHPDGLRAYVNAGADEAQVATLYYQFGLSELSSVLTSFYNA